MPYPISPRSNFGWTFVGNAIYAAGQWAILSLFAKLGSSEMLGQYALAVAVTAPIVMLSHLNLRAVLATDVGGKHPFGDYLAVRLGATGIGLAAIVAITPATAHSWAFAAAILAVGIAQSAETVSDIYYGALQRRERMDRIAWSMIGRAVVSVAALGAALRLTHRILPAVMALALGRLATLLVYDRPAGSAGEGLWHSGVRAQIRILRTASPLGIVLMLVSLNSNLPRYAIEHYLGTRELGAFAAAASFMTAGGTVINALGQSVTPRLARYFSEGDRARFRRLAAQLAGLGLALGAAGVVGALLFGRVLLRLLYRAEFEQYSGLLAGAMGAAAIGYVASAVGYAITSARAFDAQLPLFCAVAGICGLAAWVLIPRFGLTGAPMALAAAACVQVGGEMVILARAFRRRELAR
jgi:O-antigen/teichoic acid export membrane protein